MKNQFEITMDNKNKEDLITAIMVRVEGLDRNSAVILAEERFPNFVVRYILAGPVRSD